MEIKIFGKALFEARKHTGLAIYNTAIDYINKSDYLPDFYKDTGGGGLTGESVWVNTAVAQVGVPSEKQLEKDQKDKKSQISPKGVFELKMLHDQSFKINTDPKYVEEQIENFKDKLDMIKTKEFDMNRGTVEISSILTRMENRKQYPTFKAFFEEYPYTTTTRISEVLKKEGHLKLGEVSQFIADLPKEAVDAMKQYTTNTKKLCGKKPSFYIIANESDFKKSDKRRDPILLAQSPFGHFWQILGAWDEEMLLLEDL